MTKASALAASQFGQATITYQQQDDDTQSQTRTADPGRCGDAVILRKEVPASYHLAVVVDDARQGVTHVTRGNDLRAATDIQRLLQILLSLPEAAAYHHHRLVSDSAGRKLSKSAGDTAMRELRAQGVTPAQVRQRIECD
jgi:glutamyl-Q tRNA(Asp) synthetase